ncbi:uncharacterized protein [Chelonus insularis]|uniref:uncharacterized protein n=1 Tax=Chelonus insularis TaxID=460826 RepID=UPI001589C669|nr:uncharacterized protein LOC118064770 [Chelonus insularis]
MLILLFLLGVGEAASIPAESSHREIQSKKFKDLQVESSNYVQTIVPHSKYLVYNLLQVDSDKQLPVLTFPYGSPGSSYVTSSFNYYGAPLFDYEIQLRPVYPSVNVQPFIPNYIPQQPASTTTQKPLPFDEDKIEKLDEKLDPSLEMNLKHDEPLQEDDTVVVESI